MLGAIPVVGDLFDVGLEVEPDERRTAAPARLRLAEEARKGRSSDWLFVGLIMLGLLALLVGSVTLAGASSASSSTVVGALLS